jgi:hypothetical protein
MNDIKPEYLNLYEFEILESVLRDIEDLKPSEQEIQSKIARIIAYIKTRRAQKKAVK